MGWDPHLELIFTNILRTLDLPSGRGELPPRSGTPPPLACVELFHAGSTTDEAAKWIVWALGGGSAVQARLSQLLRSLESYYHPTPQP